MTPATSALHRLPLRRARRAAALLTALVLLAACAPRRIELPQGNGEEFPEYAQAFLSASAGCRGVRTLTAEASVSGTVGRGRVRGRLIAGFERAGRLRLEAVAPIGPPVFILVADAGRATLLLPRASQVLAGASPESVMDALVGVSMRPDDLGAVLAGCVAPDLVAAGGRRFPDGWARVDLEGGGAVYLRQEAGAWRIRAGRRPLYAVEYELSPGAQGAPRVVWLRAGSEGTTVANLRLSLAQVETDVPIPPRAFAIAVPPAATPITLAELRQVGPLGEVGR